MQHDTLSPAERKQLLAMAGLTPDMVDAVEAVEHATPTVVAQAVVEAATPVDDDTDDVTVELAETVTVADVVKRILDRSAGNKDKALKLADDHVQAEFDRIKLSKVQAAAVGVVSSEHNRNAWQRCQQLRDQLKVQIRAEFRENGGFVKAKVKSAKASKRSPELDAFLLANQDNDVLRQFLALQQG